MQQNDLLLVSTASAVRLKELAKHYGLRQQGKRAHWVIRKSATNPYTRQEHWFKHSTGKVDLRDALREAVPLVERFLQQAKSRQAPIVTPAGDKLTLGRLQQAYLVAPTVQANVSTRKRNWADLERIIRVVHGDNFEINGADVALVNRELAKGYQRTKLAQIEAEAQGNLLAIEAGKRAMNSTLAHAQSVFSRAAREDYHALRVPDCVRDFADALPVKARRQEEPAPLTDALVAEILAKVGALKVSSPAAWAAFQLMLWGGLRNTDCMHARVSWLAKEEAGYRLRLVPTEEYMPKGRSGAVVMPLGVVEELLALPRPAAVVEELPATGRKDDPHLVPAPTKTARHRAIYRGLNAWLKLQGVGEEASKVAYRLRRFFLSKVADQQGRLMAQLAGRHSDLATTEAHYIGAPKMAKPITL